MRRRTFLYGTVAVLATPVGVQAQPTGKMYRIGYVSSNHGPNDWSKAFLEGMRELGYVEGRNLIIEYRWAAGRLDQLPKLAVELVELRVDLIVASPTPGALAAKHATKTIPIVVPISVDAVRTGVVGNLARPGENITGLTLMSADLIGKRVELLKTAAPTVSRLAFLSVAAIPGITAPLVSELESATRALRMTLNVVEMALGLDEAAIDSAFQVIARSGAEALYVLEGPAIAARAVQIMRLALRHRLPTIGGLQEYVEAGGLLFYGPNAPDMHRRAAVFVDKILKGAKPGDLPVEQPTKLELVINLKTAKALGLTIPPSMLARADQVIE